MVCKQFLPAQRRCCIFMGNLTDCGKVVIRETTVPPAFVLKKRFFSSRNRHTHPSSQSLPFSDLYHLVIEGFAVQPVLSFPVFNSSEW